jgi:hypothetical protein
MREALYRTNLHSLPGILSEVTEVALNCIGEVEQALSQRMRALVKEHFTRLRSPEPMLQAELLAAMEGEG